MNQTENHKRPDPTDLLNQIEVDEQRLKRGKLKIFFGSSAGVGKTYAMLQEAHRRKAEGLDVLIGIIETHERVETKKLVEGLPQLGLREIDHRGVKVWEFDIDAALKRKPAILLVDELAHTNAPGCRHPKRWQDVEELLASGIDVYTTLNVQHLESLNDVVEGITGIPVREMVPDLLFDEASDVIFVDTPPDELLNRLKEGKVYIAPGANERAIQNFFRKTNLQSLRELALRRTADYVDVGTDDQRRREGLSTPNVAGDRIMVCIGPDIFAAKLVRTAKRLAAALKSPWTAVYIERADESAQDLRMRQHIQQVMQSAERNGAETVTIQGNRVGDEIINYARSRGMTKIVIGKSVASPLRDLLQKKLTDFVIKNSGDIDVYVVTTPSSFLSSTFNGKKIYSLRDVWMMGYVFSFLTAAGCVGLGYLVRAYVSSNDVVMIFLIGAVIVAARMGRGPALFYSLLSVSAFNYFFVQPVFSFNVADTSYWLTFLVMFFACYVISAQSLRLRDQAKLAKRRENETQTFYNLTKDLAGARTHKKMGQTLIGCVSDVIHADANIWYPDSEAILKLSVGDVIGDHFKEETVAKWCFDYATPAGLGTDTMPSSAYYYLPLRGTKETLGVVGIKPNTTIGLLLPDQTLMLQTFAGLLASALERSLTADAAEKSKIIAEKEKVRNILLSSVSHDLRSPLAAITGAADTLLQAPQLDKSLISSIRREASRLTRIVNNLLDITRIEGGNLKLNMQTYFPAEIIGSAVEACRTALKDHTLLLNVPDNLPLIKMDGLLMSQVIQNLLENATHHTPAGTKITVEAGIVLGAFRINVSDNGPGIQAGQEKEIFNKFATFAHGDRPKGVGLGLAICHAIVTAHQGRIWAENNIGGGSQFIIELSAQSIVPEEA